MPNYRRAWVSGGTFFFTLVTYRRQPLFARALARRLLGRILRQSSARRPVQTDAIVLLPDHLHAIWSLPPEDSDYSKRWAWIKREFTRLWLAGGGTEGAPSRGKQQERRRGVWQPRFWEHTIEDERDFERHFDYIHYNPVKHGLVSRVRDWPWSTFHRWVRAGVYPVEWGSGKKFVTGWMASMEDSVEEP